MPRCGRNARFIWTKASFQPPNQIKCYGKHPTLNIQHPTSNPGNTRRAIGCGALDVGGWVFYIPSMKFLYLVWCNLKRKKLRATLTFLSIVVAFVLFALLSALKLALAGGAVLADANRLLVRHRVSFIQPLPFSYGARIARVPGVSAVSHQSWFGGLYQDPKNPLASFPVDPEAYWAMNPEYSLPEDQKQAWLKTRTGAVVGRSLATRYGWKIGDRVPLKSPIWVTKDGSAWQFDIVGIYDGVKKNADTSQFLFRYDYFDEARSFGNGTVG